MSLPHEYRDDDLTPEERKELRRILDQERRMRWFWSTVRVWVGWISGAVVGGYALYQVIREAVTNWVR